MNAENQAILESDDTPVVQGINRYTLDINNDVEHKFFYEIYDKEKQEVVLYGDGFDNKDEIITSLSDLHEALRSIFG